MLFRSLRLYANKLPVVGACTGHAIAMGVFLLAGCDTRIGAAGEFAIGANETVNGMTLPIRSEERRVGKECRSRWSPYH